MESLVDLTERSALIDYGDPMELDDDDSPRGKTAETPARMTKALVAGEKSSSKRAQTPLASDKLRRKQQARVTRLCHKILDSEPIQTFNKNYRQVVGDWNSLKDETRILNLTASSDPRIIRSFKIIDLVLCGRRGSTLLCRLANVHLMDLFSYLEKLISFERKSGRVIRKPYYRDASVALDIYMSAQKDGSNSSVLRRKLRERRRVGRCWKDLSKPSPLLVLMYSEAAESIIKDFKRTNVLTMRSAALKILEQCPNDFLSWLSSPD